MNPSKTSSRRRQNAQPRAELLETRSLLTGGAGNIIALIPATIGTAGETIQVPFTIQAPSFTLPRGKIAIGVDVAPVSGSTVEPLISEIDNPHDEIVPQAFHSIYDPHLSQAQVARGVGTRAVLSPLTIFPGQPGRAATYNASVTGVNDATGDILVAFYLPGDADGNGVVNQADTQLVRSKLGTTSADATYDLSADANRDGRIGQIDLAYVKQNQGVATNISPTVTAELDPATDTGLADRITSQRDIHFSGAASPGATIAFAEVSGKAPEASTVVDADGRYNIHMTLGNGSNTFKVTSTDPFGQTITGQLAPVTYALASPTVAPASSTTTKK